MIVFLSNFFVKKYGHPNKKNKIMIRKGIAILSHKIPRKKYVGIKRIRYIDIIIINTIIFSLLFGSLSNVV